MTTRNNKSVKGLTYEFSSSGNPTVFSAEVKENANVWFRRYNNSAAFDAAEQEFGSAASFAGSDTPTISPSSGSSDSQPGEMFSVTQVPDGTNTSGFSLTPSNNGITGMAWDGSNFWTANFQADTVYKRDTSFVQLSSFSYPGQSGDLRGLAWDGSYLWMADKNSTIFQVDTNGNTVSSFTQNFGSSIEGIGFDGSYLYLGDGSSTTIYKAKTDGTEINKFSVSTGSIQGIGFDGKYFYVGGSAGATTSSVYRFDQSFNRVDTFANVTNNDCRSPTWIGEYLYLGERQVNSVYEFTGSNSLDISYRFYEVT